MDHEGLAVIAGEVALGVCALYILEVGLGMDPIDYAEVIYSQPLQPSPEPIAAGTEEQVVVHALPDLEVEGANAIDLDVEDGRLEGEFLLL